MLKLIRFGCLNGIPGAEDAVYKDIMKNMEDMSNEIGVYKNVIAVMLAIIIVVTTWGMADMESAVSPHREIELRAKRNSGAVKKQSKEDLQHGWPFL